MSKKINYLFIASLLILAWLIIILIVFVMLILRNPVSFSIQLQNTNQNITRGNNLTMNYKISNFWFQDIRNITVATAVLQRGYSEPGLTKIITYNKSNLFKSITGNYTINTGNLLPGKYNVISNLNYTDTNGKAMHTELSLQFWVI